jgi:hypothetical protein
MVMHKKRWRHGKDDAQGTVALGFSFYMFQFLLIRRE